MGKDYIERLGIIEFKSFFIQNYGQSNAPFILTRLIYGIGWLQGNIPTTKDYINLHQQSSSFPDIHIWWIIQCSINVNV